MWKRLIAGILVLTIAVVAIFLVNLIWFRPFSIDHFFEWAFIEFLLDDPQMISDLGIFDAVGLKFANDDLTDASPAHDDKNYDLMRRDLEKLRATTGGVNQIEQSIPTAIEKIV